MTPFPQPTATVHFYSPEAGHPLHLTIGMGRVPGWFVLTMHGCTGDVAGPFDTESEAQVVADASLVETQAYGKARGL